jgi:predicted TPR repeat methyltransferase
MPSSKPTGYYSLERTDLVGELPRPLGRVLDVGCGAGLTGKLLRSEQAERLTGVEINADAAALAREIYDDVLTGPAEEVLEELGGPFDTILCYDVLEHLVDPWRVLSQVSRLSPPGGRLHVSVPNARHLSLVIDLVVHGTFNYQSWGHRDDTHLRWFTPRDLESAVERVGFDIRSRSHPPISPTRRLLGAVTGGKSTEFLVWQWQVLAIRRA